VALAADLGVRVAGPGSLAGAALVVNALSVTPEIDMDALPDQAVLMDMTYRPLLTPWLAAGRTRGLTTVDGLAMLIGQARPSFRALFGVEPPPIDVRALAVQALGETS
jgi:shikimate dehydrogenase